MANVFGEGKTIKEICSTGGLKYDRGIASAFGQIMRKAGVFPTGHNGRSFLWDRESVLRTVAKLRDDKATSKAPDVIDLRRRVDALEKTVTDLRTALGG